eukprot:CCRYP_009739-RA/>CCRYP_009739-RA protein AED:0.05 eAED:0.05 QI:0/0.5/0.33/1/0/0/3/3256/115
MTLDNSTSTTFDIVPCTCLLPYLDHNTRALTPKPFYGVVEPAPSEADATTNLTIHINDPPSPKDQPFHCSTERPSCSLARRDATHDCCIDPINGRAPRRAVFFKSVVSYSKTTYD